MTDKRDPVLLQPKKKVRQVNSTIVSGLAGLIGSTTGKIVMHPADTIKAKLQVITMPSAQGISGKSTILKVASDTLKAEGIRGLYKGFAIHIFGSLPAGALYFGGYEMFKQFSLQIPYLQSHSFIAYLMGGIFAEALSCSIYVPVDVIKERRQVQANLKAYEYSSDYNAFRQIIKTEGLKGLYRAYWATVASFGPFSALYFVFYERLKGFFINNDAQSYLKRTEKGAPVTQDIGFFQAMACSMGAGAVASTLTNPLDMAKLRMQVMRAGKTGGGSAQSEQYYKHMLDGVWKISRDEGPRALFNGSLARVIFHVPVVAITMSIVEKVKPIIRNTLQGTSANTQEEEL